MTARAASSVKNSAIHNRNRRNRVDTVSGAIIRRTMSPQDLEPRGRPVIGRKLAFSGIAQRAGAGRHPGIEQITEPNMRACEILIAHRITPHIAAEMTLDVPVSTFYRWMQDGSTEDCADPIKIAFAQRINRARALARAECEELVSPIDALTKGPLGRSYPGLPGWTPEVRLTGPDGGPIRHEWDLRIKAGGYEVARPAQPQLEAQEREE